MTLSRVDALSWLMHFSALKSDGLDWFDFLTAIDRDDHVDVVARVADSTMTRSAMVVTAVTSSLDSLTSVFAGAGWYERETQEMFGLRFAGLIDQRPLILRQFVEPPPLRKKARS